MPTPANQPGGSTPSAARPRRHRHGFKRWIFLALVLAGAAIVAHMAYWGSRVDARVFHAQDLDRGPAAQIVPWEPGRTAVQISRVSSLSADHLWRVVTDQGRFNEFMPYVRSTTVRPGPDGTIIESQVLDLPHSSYELELEIRLKQEGSSRIARWRQVKGTLDFNEGAWVVESEGSRSVLRYQVSASLAWVPQWAINYLMLHRLGKLLEAVEARVRDLEQRQPDYFRAG
jgi:hypothetical protein